MLFAIDLLFEVELVHRPAVLAIRESGQHLGHGQSDVSRILRFPE
jgi:hypothetical protein